MKDEYMTFTIKKKKNIALIAHDNEKPKIIQWCVDHKEVLKNHNLYGTGTTARLITDKTGLRVKGYAQVYDIPMAVNRATADFMITSLYMDTEYDHEVINFNKNIQERAESM